ncbi:MAG: hypothetical protein PHT91_02920 [Candidatus Nanoarchaeia archaeon]|nr:hypothetical protein [Candidatus Nanoarchaeia archaeon]MDD5054576.1 hypothetical protein [Candidatus Nanoarchaeia archaeon]MDD5499801.1 hypothetical protein [Candidatus Nanoarchaeia archaeon]
MKKSEIHIEKLVVVILIMVVLALAIFFLMQDQGPLGWVNAISNFMNSTTDVVIGMQ